MRMRKMKRRSDDDGRGAQKLKLTLMDIVVVASLLLCLAVASNFTDSIPLNGPLMTTLHLIQQLSAPLRADSAHIMVAVTPLLPVLAIALLVIEVLERLDFVARLLKFLIRNIEFEV